MIDFQNSTHCQYYHFTKEQLSLALEAKKAYTLSKLEKNMPLEM